MAGQVSTFVFDKTGTLTEEGLSVLGIRPTTKTYLSQRGGDSSSDREAQATIFT